MRIALSWIVGGVVAAASVVGACRSGINRPSDHQVSGTVVLSDGRVLSDVAIWWRKSMPASDGGRWWPARTDDRGRFECGGERGEEVELLAGNIAVAPGVPFSTQTIGGRAHSFPTALQPVPASHLEERIVRVSSGRHGLRVTIPDHLIARVRLVGLAGALPPKRRPDLFAIDDEVVVKPLSGTDSSELVYTGVDPEKSYGFWIRIPQRGLMGHAEGIRAGSLTDVQLTVGATLVGQCVPPAGTGAFAQVTVEYRSGALRVAVQADPNGRFEITCLPRVQGVLRADNRHLGGELSGSMRVVPGSPTTVQLPLTD